MGNGNIKETARKDAGLDATCAGSFNGLFGENGSGPRPISGLDFFLSRVTTDYDANVWLKVEFRQVFALKYMAVAVRPCPCERWSHVKLYGSEGAVIRAPRRRRRSKRRWRRSKRRWRRSRRSRRSRKSRRRRSEGAHIEVKLLSKADYSLYPISMRTKWVKLVPRSVGSAHNPGATEVEFYTPRVAEVKPTCRWNPSLLSTSAKCMAEWNSYTVLPKLYGYGVKGAMTRLDFDTTPTTEYLSTLSKDRALAVQFGPRSTLGFRLSHPTVGGTVYGDCRASEQGCVKLGDLCKQCVVAKWTSCAGSNCKVKKVCFVKDLDKAQANVKACMQARCNDQCLLG